MKVVKAAHRLPGTVKCSCCGSELEFTYDDVQFDTITYGRWDSETTRNYIECPICKSKVTLPEDLNSIMPWVVEE